MGENIRRKKMSFHCHFRKISFHVISGKENVFSLSFHENLISFPFISCHFRKRKTEKEKEKEGEQYLWKNNIFRRSWRTEKEKEESTRSSGLNCAFWDDEAVYWVSIVQQYGWHLVVLSQYKVVLANSWRHWVRIGHVCLYILRTWKSGQVLPMPNTQTDRLWKIGLLSSW